MTKANSDESMAEKMRRSMENSGIGINGNKTVVECSDRVVINRPGNLATAIYEASTKRVCCGRYIPD